MTKPRCVNGRHTDHSVRQGASCDRPLPPPPLIHRAVGNATCAAVFGLAAAFVGGWKAADWVNVEGRLRWHLWKARHRG